VVATTGARSKGRERLVPGDQEVDGAGRGRDARVLVEGRADAGLPSGVVAALLAAMLLIGVGCHGEPRADQESRPSSDREASTSPAATDANAELLSPDVKGSVPGPAEPTLGSAQRTRAHKRYTDAAQLMPKNLQPGDPISDLAPLLVIDGSLAGTFGVVEIDAAGAGRIVAGPPTVYFDRSEVLLRGKPHEQLHYHWWFQDEGATSFRRQGVRMTLRSDGHPLVWEPLADASGLRLLYVSESLEAAARTTHGEPLPGRAFATEPPADAQPSIVVVRTLTDGPIPMGPWVYLDTPATDVTTFICRCMPSQVTGAMVRTDYTLRAWERPRGLPSPFAPQLPTTPPGDRLDTALRWP
jgi:hypothetical protein